MIKTYIATLLGILMVGTHVVQAQESLDDVFAQLDAANDAGSGAAAPVVVAEPVVAEPIVAQPVAAKPVAVKPVAAKPVAIAPAVVAEPVAAPVVDVAPAAVNPPAVVVSSGEMPSGDVEEADLYARGRAYYKAGDFESAEAVFETMLAIDPYDTRAMTYLKRTANRVASLEAKKQKSTRARAITEIKEGWNQDEKIQIAKTDAEETPVIDLTDQAVLQMEARVKGIRIPSLDFRDANIKDVVLFLSETCRSQDANGQGVNILLFGMDSEGAEGNKITISIRDMSLYEALQYIVEMAGLQFEVKANVVAIMPETYAPATGLVRKSYDVSRDVGESLESLSGSDDGGGVDDLFGDSSVSETTSAGPVDVIAFFSTIDFPEGTSAEYRPTFRRLTVINTLGNLKELENELVDLEDRAAMANSQQVEIEAKFVEFNEGAFEELGFNWNVYGSGTVGGFGLKEGTYFTPANGYMEPRTPYDPNGKWSPVSGNATARPDTTSTYVAGTTPSPIYTDPVRGYSMIGGDPTTLQRGQSLLGGSQRSNLGVFDAVQTGILASMGGTPAAMIFGNGDVDLRITAMEQEGTADVLSAPKVTTKSGNEAIIRIVEVHRYPQDWDVETGQKTAPVVKPQDWEDFDLGVVLKVTPVVDAENSTIDLDLNPAILKLKGFDSYKVGSNAYDVSGNNSETLAIVGDNAPLIVKMPYFELRSVQTQVTIADGSTVLMGGLVDERTETFRDQVPFLGDIPYLGRLFRTEGSRSSKKNLVIYVKATQVDFHGMSQADRELDRQTIAN